MSSPRTRSTSVTLREMRARRVLEILEHAGPLTIEDLYFRRELRNWAHHTLQLAVADLVAAGRVDVAVDGAMKPRDDQGATER